MFRGLFHLFCVFSFAQGHVFFLREAVGTAKSDMETHLKIFQKAIEDENKDVLKSMLPIDQQSDELLDTLILYHRSVKMVVEEAAYALKSDNSIIVGMVNYSKNDATKMKVEVTLVKAQPSPSGYQFKSVVHHPDVIRKRNFPTCLVGFIWCYLYLIDIMPGTVEEIFGK